LGSVSRHLQKRNENKIEDRPKPIRTKKFKTRTNPKIRNLQTINKNAQEQNFHRHLPPNVQKKKSAKKKTSFTQNNFFAAQIMLTLRRMVMVQRSKRVNNSWQQWSNVLTGASVCMIW